MPDKNSSIAKQSPAGRLLKVVLMEEGESDWQSAVNAYMVNEGLALLGENTEQRDTKNKEEIPEEALAWQDFQDEAEDAKAGIWKHDGKIEGLDDLLNDDY